MLLPIVRRWERAQGTERHSKAPFKATGICQIRKKAEQEAPTCRLAARATPTQQVSALATSCLKNTASPVYPSHCPNFYRNRKRCVRRGVGLGTNACGVVASSHIPRGSPAQPVSHLPRLPSHPATGDPGPGGPCYRRLPDSGQQVFSEAQQACRFQENLEHTPPSQEMPTDLEVSRPQDQPLCTSTVGLGVVPHLPWPWPFFQGPSPPLPLPRPALCSRPHMWPCVPRPPP